jgi:serine/threonine-protein kinase
LVGQHPYVISILDAGIFKDKGAEQYYIVSELIPGGNLREYIEQETTRSVDELKRRLEIFEKICQGVHHCHTSKANHHGFQTFGVYHGDIKPENILLRKDGNPVLTDFMFMDFDRIIELSKSDNVATVIPDEGSTTIIGTLKYMSLEQKEEGIVSPKTEVYSLGVLLADLIEGLEDIPVALRLIVQKATHINPQERFKEVEALRLEILDIIAKINTSIN